MNRLITNSVKSIFRKELKHYFTNPLGYVFMIIFLFALGTFTFEPGRGSFFLMRQADLNSFFSNIPLLFVFFIPAVSMRLWAEERRSGTIEFLLTLPTTILEAHLGKLLAAWAFLGITMALTFPMLLTVGYLGAPDWSVIFFGYLGCLFLAGAFLSIGLFFSSLTKNQVISFILSIVASYLLLMAGSPPMLELLGAFAPRYVIEVFESLSALNHFETMSRGVFSFGNFWYFTLMIAGWSFATVSVLQSKRAE